MNSNDRLLELLIEFFNLPPDTRPENVTQEALPAWDSLASVQLISELQFKFSADFDVDQIESMRRYDQIRRALVEKGIPLNHPIVRSA
jgi:acyl carrier protein